MSARGGGEAERCSPEDHDADETARQGNDELWDGHEMASLFSSVEPQVRLDFDTDQLLPTSAGVDHE